jgi:hypothetical protein
MNGRLIDLRKEGIENRVQTQTNSNWVPEGKTNILFDIVAVGKRVGDLELGDDGFLQINILNPRGFIKINTHVDVKSYGADKGIKTFAEGL